MWLLFLEAISAFLIFALIIWWTMFSGAKPTDMHQEDNQDAKN